MDNTNLIEILEYINPADCDYQEWINIGMALKHEGYSVHDWDAWSSRDFGRYHSGECDRKWRTFSGSASPVTAGTIVQMAKDNGWKPEVGHELDWGDEIVRDDMTIVDKNWLEGVEVHAPKSWSPVQDLIRYLETLFEPGENVGYVTASWQNDKGKYIPQNKGNWDRTAGQLIEALAKCGGDIGSVIGDYNADGGAWIRFNPLDGKGVKNENVSEFRYALVESDGMEIDKQNAILRELELPIAALVHSGKKSLHAIVRIEASDYSEYRKRVDYLYSVCEKNGMLIDKQNRNPSRLSRMPGVMRGENPQFIIDTNIGKSSWSEWHEWIEGVNDDLPDPEGLEAVWDNMPEKAPCLIENVLREGHKMLITGSSKAGKSFLLIELCIAIAEGKKWLNWQCAQGRVMYVNLELDKASCFHRFKDVYTALGIAPNNLQNIDIWNLRGKSLPMDKLAPKLIRRASKKNYATVIIDPIYKIITGDENSADQMAAFCNQFDRVCNELGCATIYCHHHSKGAQGGKKSMDRASGSGVFARDPDAILDMIELETTDALMKQETNKALCATIKSFMDSHNAWKSEPSQDELLSASWLEAEARQSLPAWQVPLLEQQIKATREAVKARSAWRIEGTLREFATFPPVNLWFKYPAHSVDDVGSLGDIKPDGAEPVWEKAKKERKKQAVNKKLQMLNELEIAFSEMSEDGDPKLSDIAEAIGTSEKNLKEKLGDGKRRDGDFCKVFEKYIGEDGANRIRRKVSSN